MHKISTSWLVSSGVVLVMLAITAVSAVIPDSSGAASNVFAVLSYVEPAIVLLGSLLALRALAADRRNAPGRLGLAIYIGALGVTFAADRRNAPGRLGLAIYIGALGVTFVWAASSWSGSDNSFLGLLALGVPSLLMGSVLAVAGLIGLIAGSSPAATRPHRALAGHTLLLAALAAAFTVGWFLLRGPGDWATSSATLNLFSLPLVLAAAAIGTLIMRAGQRSAPRAHGHTQ